MALSESAGQRPALLRPAQGRDDRAYWHELFGSLEVVHFFLVTARCGCFMQAARSLDVKPTLLRKTLARLEERLGLHLFVHEGNALSLTREGRIVQAAGQRLVEDSQSHADLHRQQPLVRLAVAESVLHDVLSRELWGYLRKNANLRVALAELREGWPESAGPAEIAIWIADPGQPHPAMEGHFAAPTRIAELEYQPHIGKRYSRERTRPASEDELDDYLLAQLHGQAASAALAPWNRR
ncbi:LysR family transcriptional regulator, partial [Pseudomonas aeruginosa]